MNLEQVLGDQLAPHFAQNRETAASKLRRGGKNCPVCLAVLPLNARRTRRVRCCAECQAHPDASKRCAKCSGASVWSNKSQAACQACGAHGIKAQVLAA